MPARPATCDGKIPLAGDVNCFRVLVKAGRKLIDLHVNYEKQGCFSLKYVENRDAPLDWRVEAMKLNKDRDTIQYNDFLSLTGVPSEAFDYRLGNRSAIEWIVDQYRVTRDERGDIVDDPNRPDDEQYIVRLVGQVISVSLATNAIVGKLPALSL